MEKVGTKILYKEDSWNKSEEYIVTDLSYGNTQMCEAVSKDSFPTVCIPNRYGTYTVILNG